jgi:hypothetical protein
MEVIQPSPLPIRLLVGAVGPARLGERRALQAEVGVDPLLGVGGYLLVVVEVGGVLDRVLVRPTWTSWRLSLTRTISNGMTVDLVPKSLPSPR